MGQFFELSGYIQVINFMHLHCILNRSKAFLLREIINDNVNVPKLWELLEPCSHGKIAYI